jgi:aminomethyltransferase
MKRTPMHEEHTKAGARMVEFAGFDMPVLYTSVIEEHLHCRRHVGLFDVSHMGEVVFRGPDALNAVNRLITNDLAALEDGRAAYSPMCLPDGGIVDDVIAYRLAADRVLVCVNASNVDKDYRWMVENSAGLDCTVSNESERWAQIAVQGPKAPQLLARLFGDPWLTLPPFRVREQQLEGRSMIVATTGYTGERGGEIYCAAEDGAWLWRTLLERGADLEPRPIGLGARDTLRLEYKYCLYGNDIDETTNPLEAGLGWTVKLTHDFIGRGALEAVKAAGSARKLVGFRLVDKGIARHGNAIVSATGEPLGHVTSGTQSPSLDQAIGLAYVAAAHAAVGAEWFVDLRGKHRKAVVVATPFLQKTN